MLEFLPQDIRDGLAKARRRAWRRGSKLHVQLGDAVFPVLRFWPGGMALDAGLAPRRLRGLVDIYDGPRHVFQCLIVASALDGDELVCEFKRATAVADGAALDYWRESDLPAGYLPPA